ncbi:tetratricopeptide repeat protein [Streptosporangium lutulentum]
MARYVAALRVAGRFEEALKCNLALVATLSDPAYGASPAVINLTLGSALGQLGTTYLALERWEEAIDAYQRALPHHAAYALTWALGLTQRRLGTALRRLDRIEEARQALTEAARLYEEDGDTEQVAEVVKELEEIAAPSATAER